VEGGDEKLAQVLLLNLLEYVAMEKIANVQYEAILGPIIDLTKNDTCLFNKIFYLQYLCFFYIIDMAIPKISIYSSAKISLGGTIKNHIAKITRKLDPIFKINFHLFIHWII
jgi:hypothetical protein